jgi:uncharacterized membrane protein
MTGQDKLSQLQTQIDRLLEQQLASISEIRRLQKELEELRSGKPAQEPPKPAFFKDIDPVAPVILQKLKPETVETGATGPPPEAETPGKQTQTTDWEQYIGGNVINKIGIVVLLIGLGLFVKYAIDKGLFPPPVRVILGYVSGLVLTGLAWWLKEKYLTYSAVLFGGGMAALYFTTYIGCTFFTPVIIPVLPAFNLMAVLMAVTLIVAGKYNSQIIGILGLVGAYAVPFLVNTGTQNYLLFFAYITLINVGVLILAAKKVWRTMTWSACLLTWLIAAVSLASGWSRLDESFEMWAFSIVSFQIFYAAILAGQLWEPQKISAGTFVLASFNALFFYLLTLFLTNEWLTPGRLTFLHCIPHFAVAYLLFVKLENRFPATFFTLTGLLFLTGAIAIEFERSTIIWLWMAEAALLFFLARKFASRSIEIFALSVGTLAILILMGSWDVNYFTGNQQFPVVLNGHFANHLWVLAGVVGFYFIDQKFPGQAGWRWLGTVLKVTAFTLLYFLFFNELYHWFDLRMQSGAADFGQWQACRFMGSFNYTALFVAAIGVGNLARWKNEQVAAFISITSVLLLTVFLTLGMQQLNFLRDAFLLKQAGFGMFGLRYVCYVFFAGLAIVFIKTIKQFNHLGEYEKLLPALPHVFILTLLSHELIAATLLALGTTESPIPYREGLSILWGVYSLLLIGLGIWKKSQVLRVAGMALFGVTLGKVFFMDLENLPIISRTMLFIGLGVLLLFASYLYQKFRDNL